MVDRPSTWAVWRDNLAWWWAEAVTRVAAGVDLVRYFVRARGNWRRMAAAIDEEQAALRAAIAAGVSIEQLREVEEALKRVPLDGSGD